MHVGFVQSTELSRDLSEKPFNFNHKTDNTCVTVLKERGVYMFLEGFDRTTKQSWSLSTVAKNICGAKETKRGARGRIKQSFT